MITGAIQHSRICLPGLGMRFRDVLLVSFVATVAGTAFVYGCSFDVGFQVPFSQVDVTATAFPAVVICLYVLWREVLSRNPTLRVALRRQFLVLAGVGDMPAIYLVYFLIFKSLSPRNQSAFTLLLPIINLGFKNYFTRAGIFDDVFLLVVA